MRLKVPNATKSGHDRPRKVVGAGSAVLPRGLPVDLIWGLNVTTFEYGIAVTHQLLVRLFGRSSFARPTMESMPL